MTKDQFISAIKSQRDTGFLTAILEAAIDTLPKGYADNFLYEMYASRIYEGQVYTLTHKDTGKRFIFAGVQDVHTFFREINPKYCKENLFRVRNKEGRTIYDYYITYVERKETSN